MLANVSAVGTLAVMPTAPAPHVLVVDDEPIVRDVLTRYLTRAGYRVSDAVDGEQALEAISAGHPDVVLLDLMLPRVNGLDVLRTVRRDSDVPVIVLSARSSEVERIDGLRQGADDYVVKPYSPARWWPGWRRCCAAPARPGRRCSAARDHRTAAREVRLDGQVVDTTRRSSSCWICWSAIPARCSAAGGCWSGSGMTRGPAPPTPPRCTYGRLRAKVELEPSAPRHLVMVHGVGYGFDP